MVMIDAVTQIAATRIVVTGIMVTPTVAMATETKRPDPKKQVVFL